MRPLLQTTCCLSLLIVFLSTTKTFGQNTDTRAGTIAPDAVYFDVDVMYPFYGSIAVLKKGQAYAAINAKGEFVVPFGKYEFRDYPAPGTDIYPPWVGKSGMYQAHLNPVKIYQVKNIATENIEILDENGKLFRTLAQKLGEIDNEGFYYEIDWGLSTKQKPAPGVKYSFVKYDGERITASSSYQTFFNGLTPFAAQRNPKSNKTEDLQTLLGFIDRRGRVKIKPEYKQVTAFSEGIAFVSKDNEFGEEKWGAIDTAGQLVIPFKFTNQPTYFNCGRAWVLPVNMPEVTFICIDKKGNQVFSLPSGMKDTTGIGFYGDDSFLRNRLGDFISGRYGLFKEGYNFVNVWRRNAPRDYHGYHLLDTSGHYFPIEEVLRKNLKEYVIEGISYSTKIKDGQFVFDTNISRYGGVGMARINGDIVLPPVFDVLNIFDEKSPLQYAEHVTFTDSGKKTIKGYISKDGIFHIVLKEKKGF